MQYLVLFGTVDADVLCCAEIANLRIERSQFGHFNEGSEAFLLYDVIRDGKLVIGGLFCEHGCPCVKAVDTLLFQCLWTKVFEE